MEFNIEQTGIFQAQSKIICLSSSHFLVDTTLYWLKENIHSVYLCLASAPMSAVISQTHLLYASGNSLILLDLKSHDTCEKPQHKHLESQILL